MRTFTTLGLIGSWLGMLGVAGLLLVLFGLIGSLSTGSSTLAAMVFVLGATVAAIAFVLSDVHEAQADRHHHHHHP